MRRLIMRRGPTPGTIYELTAAEIAIGRGSKNNIIIRDNEVSREHCRLVRVDNSQEYEVVDLNSSNGTFLNGQRVTGTRPLNAGSIIELGDSITLEYDHLNYSFTRQLFHSTLPPLEDKETSVLSIPVKHLIIVYDGANQSGAMFRLQDPIVTIGRDLNNDILINDPEVSRYHLRIRMLKQGCSVEDLGSSNGTMVNGERIHAPTILNPDDEITIGTTVVIQYIQRPIVDIENASLDVAPSQSLFDLSSIQDAEVFRDITLNSHMLLGQRTNINTSRLGTGIEPGLLEDHIFLAYGRENWNTVIAPLVLSLQDAGLSIWVDQYLQHGSDDWRAGVEQAIMECWLMVFVVTAESLNDNTLKMAYRYFIKAGKPVIPIIIDRMISMPPDLMRTRTLFYDHDNPRRSFHKLIFEIMQQRS